MRDLRAVLVLAAVAFLACSKKKDLPPDAPPKAPLEAFAGSAPALPPEVKIRQRMPLSEARKAMPGLREPNDIPLPGYAGVKLNVSLLEGDQFVRGIELQVSPSSKEVDEHLTRLWGPPKVKQASIGATRHIWTNAAGGVRAELEVPEPPSHPASVWFWEAQTVDRFLGADAGKLTFEPPGGLVGKTFDEVAAALPGMFYTVRGDTSSGGVWLPYLDVGPDPPVVNVEFADGKVKSYTVGFGVEWDPPAEARVKAALEKKFGAGAPHENLPGFTRHPGPPPAIMSIEGGRIGVVVNQ